MSTFRNLTLGLAAGAAALAFAGPALALDEITFGTNWLAQAEHGGFYQAVADGTYEKYGLEVTIIAEGRRRRCCSAGKIEFYMGGNLLGTFSAVEQDMPVIEVAAIFQKDPQVLMAHPEAGLKKFADLAKLPTIFIGDDLFVTGYPVDEGGLSRLHGRAAQALQLSTPRPSSPTRNPASRATSPPSPSRSRRKAASSRRSSCWPTPATHTYSTTIEGMAGLRRRQARHRPSASSMPRSSAGTTTSTATTRPPTS